MKTSLSHISFLIVLISFCSSSLHAQKNKYNFLDSSLAANSDKWKVKLHKGFGLGKPEFGPYTTLDVEKLDSAAFKRKTKDSSYSGGTISSDGWDWDFSKYETIEKAKAYRMTIATEKDTAEMLFSIYKISKEKHLTFFGEMMSKNDEDKNAMLGYKTNISGIMSSSYDTARWRFFIEDSGSTSQQTMPPFVNEKFTGGYVINENDSIYSEPILSSYGSPGSKYFFQSETGVFANNINGEHIAALKFGAWGDSSNPFEIWIRKDIEPGKQHAIASLFALMIIVKTY